jgi:uncharacterized protein (TIGR02452 family)
VLFAAHGRLAQRPFFKDDAGDLLAAPYVADIITAAAPNFGAVEANQAADPHRVLHVLRERADRVQAWRHTTDMRPCIGAAASSQPAGHGRRGIR